MAYGEDEQLPSIDFNTDNTERYKILNSSEYNEESLSYSKMKLHRIKETRSEECLNNKRMSKKKQMTVSNEGSMSNGTSVLANQEFTCKDCNKSFGFKHVLKTHQRTHTGEKPFECKVCNKRFGYKHVLKNHERMHSDEISFDCKECNKSYTRDHHLQKHMQIHTSENSYHYSRTQDIASKLNNNNTSFVDTAFQIRNCKLSDNHSDNAIIQDEAKEIVGNTSEGNISESGSEKYIQIKSLDKIKDCVTVNGMKKLQNCSYSQNDSSKNDLSKNYDNYKTKRKDKEKTSCNLEHSKIHNNNISSIYLPKKFICKLCKNKFRTKELLNEHMAVHQSKKYDCSKCGQQFTKLYEVAMHMHMHAHREKWENNRIISENNSDESVNMRKSVSFNDEVNVKYINCTSDLENTFQQTKTSHSNKERLHSKYNNIEMTSLPVRQTDESRKVTKLEAENNSVNKTSGIIEETLIKKERGNFECGYCNFTCDLYKSLLLHRHTHSNEYQNKVLSDLKKSGNTESTLIDLTKHKNNKSNTNNTNKENNHELVEKTNSNKRNYEIDLKSYQESNEHKICKLDNKYPTSHDIYKFNNTMKNVETKEPNGLPLDNEIINTSNGDIEDFSNIQSTLNNGHIIKNLAESELKHLQSIENDTELLQSHTKSVPLPEKINKRVNKKGETKLIRACMLNKEKEVRKLLSVPGININKTDYAGWTALHEAAIKGNTIIVMLLLDFQPRAPDGSCVTAGYCDVTKKGAQGMTALHDSVAEGHIDIVKLLLEYGGNTLLKIRNSSSKLASDMTNDADILNLLESFEGTIGKHFER